MNYRGFNFTTDGENPAVVPNSEAAASQLGYSGVEEVCIAGITITVGDGESTWFEKVGDGKYRSAVFVEAMLAYRGHSRGLMSKIVVDEVFMLALRGYMGERVWAEATDSNGEKHGFIRALLRGQGKDVTIDVTWKKPAA